MAISASYQTVQTWQYPNDPRQVSLLREGGKLALKVYNRFSHEESIRHLRTEEAQLQGHFVEHKRPELSQTEDGGRPLSAVLVDSEATLLGKLYSSSNGSVEVKVYKHPTRHIFVTITDTAKNKSSTLYEDNIKIKGKGLSGLVHVHWRYIAQVRYDKHDVPFALAYKGKKIVPYNLEGISLLLLTSPGSLQYQISRDAPPISATLHPSTTLEEALADPKALIPIPYPDGSFCFEKKVAHPSKFSPSQTVDQKAWAITLVASKSGSGTFLGGHASIFVEGVRQGGQYFMERCHISSVACGNALLGTPSQAAIEVEDNDTLSSKFSHLEKYIVGKSETWVKPRSSVVAMLDPIHEQKGTLVPFNIRGWDATDGYNCMSWAKKQLEYAGIELPDLCEHSFATYPLAFVDLLPKP